MPTKSKHPSSKPARIATPNAPQQEVGAEGSNTQRIEEMELGVGTDSPGLLTRLASLWLDEDPYQPADVEQTEPTRWLGSALPQYDEELQPKTTPISGDTEDEYATGSGLWDTRTTGKKSSRFTDKRNAPSHDPQRGGIHEHRTETSSGYNLSEGQFGQRTDATVDLTTYIDGMQDVASVNEALDTRQKEILEESAAIDTALASGRHDKQALDKLQQQRETLKQQLADNARHRVLAATLAAQASVASGVKENLRELEAQIEQAEGAERQRLLSDAEAMRDMVLNLDQILHQQAEGLAADAEVLVAPSTYQQGTSKSDRSYVDFDLGSGRLGDVTEQEQTTENRDTKESQKTKENNFVQLDEGVYRGRERTRTSAVTDKATGTTSTTESSSTVRGGLAVKGEDEAGIGFGGSKGRKNERTDRDGNTIASTESSAEGNIAVTNKGVYLDGKGKLGGATKNGGMSLSIGGHFNATVNVEPVGKDRYTLVLVVDTGVDVGLDGSLGREGRDGNLGGRLTAGALQSSTKKMTYTRSLSLEEAEQYLGRIERASNGEEVGKLPEFGMLSRLSALTQSDVDLSLADARLAAELSEGETVTIDLGQTQTLKLGGEASYGGYQAGLDGEKSHSLHRTLSARAVRNAEGDERIRVTLSLGDKDASAISGKFGATLTFERGFQEHEGGGLSVTVELDPASSDFQTLYDRLTSPETRAELDALRSDPELQEHITRTSMSTSKGNTDTVGASVEAAKLHGGTAREEDSTVTYSKKDGLEADVTGSRTDSATLEVADVKVADSSNRSEVKAKVGENTKVTLQTTRNESGLLTSTPQGSKKEPTWDQLMQGPKKNLENFLSGARKSIWGLTLDDHALDVLGRRARYLNQWDLHGPQNTEHKSWLDLRKSLHQPQLPAEYPMLVPTKLLEEPELVAIGHRITQARALARFIARAGEGGQCSVYNVLRKWNDIAGRRPGAEDAGELFMWPSELVHLKPVFDDLIDRSEQLTGLTGAADLDLDAIEALEPRKAFDRANEIYTEIDGCKAFSMPTAQGEMLEKLEEVLYACADALQWLEEEAPSVEGLVAEHKAARLVGHRRRFDETALKVERIHGRFFGGFSSNLDAMNMTIQLEEILQAWCGDAKTQGVPLGSDSSNVPQEADISRIESFYKANPLLPATSPGSSLRRMCGLDKR